MEKKNNMKYVLSKNCKNLTEFLEDEKSIL